jgi:hypothetical protein
MEELEIEPPERASSSGGIAGPSPRSTPGFEHNVEDTLMEYEDSDLEQEADEYRAMLVGASGGRVFRNIGAFTTPKPKNAKGRERTPTSTSSRRTPLSPGASMGSRGSVRGSLHRPSRSTPSAVNTSGPDEGVDASTLSETPVGGGQEQGIELEAGAFGVASAMKEFEAIRRELAEIKSSMSPSAQGGTSAAGTPGTNDDVRGEYAHGPKSPGGRSLGLDSSTSQKQQRRDSNGSTGGGKHRPAPLNLGSLGSAQGVSGHASRGGSKSGKSERHRGSTHRRTSVETDVVGGGRLLFGDDDENRRGDETGEMKPTTRTTGEITEEPAQANETDSRNGISRRDSLGDSLVSSQSRSSADEAVARGSRESSLKANLSGGSGRGSRDSSLKRGARLASPPQSPKPRVTRETAVNTEPSEAETSGRDGIGSDAKKSDNPSIVLSALSLMAPISLLLATVYMVLVILDVIEEDFLSGRLPRSNSFLDALATLPRQFLSKFLPMPGDDDNDPPFAAPT